MNKLLVGIIVLIIVLGGGYFIVKSMNQNNSSSQGDKQQTAQPTSASTASPSIDQTQSSIVLSQSGFSPTTLTIKAGETVTWINKSGEDATVNSNPHPTHTDYLPLNLGSFSDGGSLSLSFPKAGTYGYHNHLNPGETGTIIVK